MTEELRSHCQALYTFDLNKVQKFRTLDPANLPQRYREFVKPGLPLSIKGIWHASRKAFLKGNHSGEPYHEKAMDQLTSYQRHNVQRKKRCQESNPKFSTNVGFLLKI